MTPPRCSSCTVLRIWKDAGTDILGASCRRHLVLASTCALLLVRSCLADTVTGDAIGGTPNAAEVAESLSELHAKFALLSDKLEGMTHQVQGFLQAAEVDDAARAQLNIQAVEVGNGDAEDGRQQQDGNPSSTAEGSRERQARMSAHPPSSAGDQPRDGGGAVGNDAQQDPQQAHGAGAQASHGRGFGPIWLVLATFVHEVWIGLQHANILLNPLCQRLDRGYGVALLRRRLYWVIATVLAAYWAREVVSMLLAAPYASPLTLKMILVSAVYHVGKISLISLDASRGWSPTLGIMRLLMDHWHLSSFRDLLLCVKRFALQAFDTATHALIVRDMLHWDAFAPGTQLRLGRVAVIVAGIWVVHAIGNLVTRKSTATLVVEFAKGAVGSWGSEHREASGRAPVSKARKSEGVQSSKPEKTKI